MEERIVSLIGDVCNGIPNIPEFGTGTIEQLNILISPDENHCTNIDNNSQEVITLYIFCTHILNKDVLVYLFYYLILLVYSNVYTMLF